jgi:hypothetical protein
LPKSLQAKAKAKLHQIWQAPEKDEAQLMSVNYNTRLTTIKIPGIKN